MENQMAKSTSELLDRNKRIVTQSIDYLNRGMIDEYMSLLSDDFVWKSDTMCPVPCEITGHDFVRSGTERLLTDLPGFYMQIVELIAEGDRVVLISNNWNTGSTKFMGLPAIDKSFRMSLNNRYIISPEGKIKELWGFWDRAWILIQLGILPTVGAWPPPGTKINWARHISDPSAQEDFWENRLDERPLKTSKDAFRELITLPFHIASKILQNRQ